MAWIIVAGIVVVFVPIAVIFGIAIRDGAGIMLTVRRNDRLGKTGIPATAVILSVRETGAALSRVDPQVALRLEVHTEDGGVFEAETEAFIAQIAIPQFQPGCVIDVRYDPNDRRVAVAD